MEKGRGATRIMIGLIVLGLFIKVNDNFPIYLNNSGANSVR